MTPMTPLGPARTRQEAERARLLRVTQHIPITVVATGGTVLYTNAATTDFLIPSLWVSNITASDATIGLYVGAVADANAIMKGFVVSANSGPVAICSANGVRVRLQPGAVLRAVASASSALNMGGWGVETAGGEE